ncbi:hypothetical protein OUZ56_025108 [Daphnia magna]|uniref:Sodium/hydrogen exchanger n=1 Tax=Daphnia magna TaxID=35525 RepID=A0ABQ9ZIW1_9CRUS|nr:hypothetical protein OUZ56_025108 [Daphnia magna]
MLNEYSTGLQTEKDDSGQPYSSTHSYTSPATTTVRPQIPIAKPNFPRVAVPFVIAMWVFGTCIAKIILSGWPKLLTWVPESCCLILAGITVGIIFYLTETTVLSPLSSTIFFFCMLPPIIFDAGFFMPNRPFFDHLGTILLFAVMGTIFNTVCIGMSLWACGLSGIYGFEISLLETLIFSALISAVDPVAVLSVFEEIHVDKVLYIIVFGESLLNDAVTVVLYNMCDSYISLGPENIETIDVLSGFASFLVVALGGTTIGIFWGFLTGFVTKYTHRVLVIEPIFVFIMSYVAYLNAEAFQMSGILSIMFCGITMKNYVAENMSSTSLTTVKCGLKVLSNGSESIIFVFLGISTVNDNHEWNTAFILLTIFFCSLYRALGVVILTELANYFRLHQLNRVEKFVMSYGGLRGAIAFALVLLIDPNRIPRQPLFVTATISVVFFTVFVQGITIKPLVEFLKVKREEKWEKTMNERLHEKMLDYTMAGVVDILGQLSSNKVRDKFKQLDYAYIRPHLIREKKHHEPKIFETYSKLTLQDAIEFARRNPSSWMVHGTNSFANFINNEAVTNVPPANLSESVVNIDLGELNFTPSTKDLWDAEIHHTVIDRIWTSRRSKGDDTNSDQLKNHSKRRRSMGSGASHKQRSKKEKSVEAHYEIRNRQRSAPTDAEDMKIRMAANHDEEGEEEGISFTVNPDIYEKLTSDETATVQEMSLPWKTDNGPPQQRD